MILLFVISIFLTTLEPWVLGVATVAEASDKAFCSGLDRVGWQTLTHWIKKWCSHICALENLSVLVVLELL